MRAFFHDLWNMPFPEVIAGRIGRVFDGIKPEKPLSKQMYLILSAIICLASIVVMFALGGTMNPVDLFLEIPMVSFYDFLDRIPNYTSITWAEFTASSALVTFVIMYLVHFLIFRRQDYPKSTPNGIVYMVMSFFLAIAVNMICAEVFIPIHINYITDTAADPATLALLLLSYFGLYFMLKDACEAELSFALTPFVCNLLGAKVHALGLLHYIVASIIIKTLVWVVSVTGIWNVVVRFIGKWCYTFKYLFRMTIIFYLFVILVMGGWLIPGYFARFVKRISKAGE